MGGATPPERVYTQSKLTALGASDLVPAESVGVHTARVLYAGPGSVIVWERICVDQLSCEKQENIPSLFFVCFFFLLFFADIITRCFQGRYQVRRDLLGREGRHPKILFETGMRAR